MAFYRYVQPAYFGAPAIPQGPAPITFNGTQYRFFNVTSGGVGAGDGSAYMDTAKADGPNTGTFAVAYSEQARSIYANRGMRALAENTDHLDDLFHRDLAAPIRTGTATAGVPVSSIALPAGTFVGNTGTYPMDGLFSILDEANQEILNGSVKVVVQSISGAALGSGFSTGVVTLNLNVAIPATTVYRVYYATRTNLATLPVDALTSITVRIAEEVAAPVRNAIEALNAQIIANTNAIQTNTSSIAAIRQLPAGSGLVVSASGVGANVAYGTSNQVVKMNQEGTALEFVAPHAAGGALSQTTGGQLGVNTDLLLGTKIDSNKVALHLHPYHFGFHADGTYIKFDDAEAGSSGIRSSSNGLYLHLNYATMKLDASGAGVDTTKVAALVDGKITAANSRGNTLRIAGGIATSPFSVGSNVESPGNAINSSVTLAVGDEIVVDCLFSCAHTSGTSTTSYYNCKLQILSPTSTILQEIFVYASGPMGRVSTTFLRHKATVAGAHLVRATVWKLDAGTATTNFNVVARWLVFSP